MEANYTTIPSHHSGLRLAVRHAAAGRGMPVLYVHGATFPSALSVGYRFDGRSWEDDLVDLGFDPWSFDFLGFGRSDRFPEMAGPAEAHEPLGATADAAPQIETVVRHVLARTGAPRLSIIAHSWGTMATGLFATRCPELVDRLVFFGPITRRDGKAKPAMGAWSLVTLEAQWTRFIAEVPRDEPAVLSRRHFEEWGPLYLASDPGSADRMPPAVRVPAGPAQGIADALAGRFGYDPARVRAPVVIIRGEWDSLCTDADAAWLFGALESSPVRRDVKISRATHLMHLESGRFALHRETAAFLAGGDLAPEG